MNIKPLCLPVSTFDTSWSSRGLCPIQNLHESHSDQSTCILLQPCQLGPRLAPCGRRAGHYLRGVCCGSGFWETLELLRLGTSEPNTAAEPLQGNRVFVVLPIPEGSRWAELRPEAALPLLQYILKWVRGSRLWGLRTTTFSAPSPVLLFLSPVHPPFVTYHSPTPIP